jgi:hypothetical protein
VGTIALPLKYHIGIKLILGLSLTIKTRLLIGFDYIDLKLVFRGIGAF